MKILKSTINDIDYIFKLYDAARDVQRIKGAVMWPLFSRSLIENEISEGRQFKISIDDRMVCTWAITFNDEQIWQTRHQDAALYIHRIATNPNYRGHNFVGKIITWAKSYATKHDIDYLRMDTVGNNKGLIHYYQSCGFDFLGLHKLNDTVGLPAHYHDAEVSLFQIAL